MTTVPSAEVVEERRIATQTHALTVRVTNTTDALMNQIMWSLTREIPTAALKSVTFQRNTSPLSEEYIAHRLALVPMRARDGTACARGSVSLHAHGSNRGGGGRVYASALEGDFVALSDTPIALLADGCELQLTGVLDTGIGKVHQRYNHVAAARVQRRSDSVPLGTDECWCTETTPGQWCAECAGTRAATGSTVRHILAFEAFGTLSPREALRQALLVTREKVLRIEIDLKGGALRPSESS